jgi:hypothetical protein
MNVTILLDHDIEGLVVFIEAGLMETGWAQDLNIQFKRLRDANLAEDSSDEEVWRYVQQRRLLLVTNNRNREDDSSLEAVIERENRSDSLPVLTISDQAKLILPEYRRRVADKLASIIIDLENYLGTGRIFLP